MSAGEVPVSAVVEVSARGGMDMGGLDDDRRPVDAVMVGVGFHDAPAGPDGRRRQDRHHYDLLHGSSRLRPLFTRSNPQGHAGFRKKRKPESNTKSQSHKETSP